MKLHLVEPPGREVWVNLDRVALIYPREDGGSNLYIDLPHAAPGDECVSVKESCEQIRDKLTPSPIVPG